MADEPVSGFAITYRDQSVVSWTPAPRAVMECHSHALIVGEGTWLIDPIDVPGLEDLLGELPPVAGVIVLLDRHKRDANELAARYGVEAFMPRGTRTRSATIYDDEIPGTPFEVITTSDHRGWHERALWWEERQVLVVADVVGAARYYRVGDDTLAVHPLLRLVPARQLDRFEPELVLVGHGPPIADDAATALHEALATSRRKSVRLALETPRRLLRWGSSPRQGC